MTVPAVRKPRLLVIGATGMLGHMACRVFADRFDVRGTCRGAWRSHPDLDHVIREDHCIEGCDAMDSVRLRAVLRQSRPAVVLNCVGLIKQKQGSGDSVRSIALNALLPHQLAEWCTELEAKLVHISTDCVFSGAKGNYAESDPPDCIDLYGRSKFLGEVATPPHLTLRTSMIGRQLSGSESLVEWFISQRGGKVRGFTKAIFSGLTTQAFCRVIERILTDSPHFSGVYQVASEPISKFELLTRINHLMNLGATIEPDHSFICDRSLDGSRFAKDSGIEIPSWDAMLEELASDGTIYARQRQ